MKVPRGGGGHGPRWIGDADSSTEEIVRKDRGEGGRHGGIQIHVERTVVVREDSGEHSMDYDVERGIYDWEHTGTAEHRVGVASRR